MTEREEKILGAIIDYYLDTGKSLGSRTLVKKYNLDLSSATIRNVMADLEDMEYISKTHSSSGRLPTTKGYKYYLDTILEIRKVTFDEMEKITIAYENNMTEIDKILEKTSNILSNLSNYAGIALESKEKTEIISKIELIFVNSNTIFAVFVSENSNVRTKKIHIDIPINEDEVKKIGKIIDKKIKNLNMNYLTYKSKYLNLKSSIEVLEEIIFEEIIEECYRNDEGNIFINGTPSIIENINSEEINIVDTVKIFDKKDILKKLFENFMTDSSLKEKQVNVVLGEELNIDGLENLSLVFSAYNIGETKGIIGIIGPKRMEYSKTLGIVEYVKNEVVRVLNSIEKGEE